MPQRKSLLIVLDAARRRETLAAMQADRLRLLREAAQATLIAPSCWTVPSVASMLTGLFPSEHGRQWPLNGEWPAVATIADFLERAGRRFLLLSGNNLCAPPLLPLREDHVIRPQANRRFGVALGRTLGGLDYGSREILSVVERMAEDGMLPDLLVVHLQEAHHPYLPPPAGLDPAGRARYAAGHLRYYLSRRAQVWEFAAHAQERAWAAARTRYEACVRHVVGTAEAILRAYERANVLEETLAIVTADHGEHLGEHGLADHQASLHEELVNCPCLLIAPHLEPRGRIPGLFQHTDLLPTVGNWLEVPTEGWRPGWPGLDMLDPARACAREYAFSEWQAWGREQREMLQRRNPGYDFAPLDRDLVAVRSQRWKLIEDADGVRLLYDLRSDPDEQHDLSARKPEVLRELTAALQRWRGAVRPANPRRDHDAGAPGVRARLRELGYV